MSAIGSLLLVTLIPGALLFRCPMAGRDRRAALPGEERVFWYVILSLVISSIVGLSLAAGGWYTWGRLLATNAAVSLCLVGVSRGRLALGPTAPRPGRTALIPIALLAMSVALIFHVPPAEYVMGGRDPGVYMNEGIQIAQRGALEISDPLVTSIPPPFRPLFFPARNQETYYSTRFMGFFLRDPDQGTVVGQFPHLYPLWVAIGYGTNGLSGARYAIGLWAVLGVLTVYFAGSWLVGRTAAAAGAGLLGLHVTQVWYGRYPNSEILLQVLLFAALLAFSRASVDRDRFFAPVAALLVVLAVLAHFTAVLAIAGIGGAAILGIVDARRLQASFLIPLVVGTGVAILYYATILEPYFERPLRFLLNLQPDHLLGITAALLTGAVILWGARHGRASRVVTRALPIAVVAVLWMLALYAYYLREPRPGLPAHDAEALRVITEFYLTPVGLLLALLGFSALTYKRFWPGLAYVATIATFAGFFFFKMRIIPEHFWTARRYLPVVLPAAFLMIGAAAFPPSSWRPSFLQRRGVREACAVIGIAITITVGLRFATQTTPILNHVEYAGLIPRLETLSALFEDHDLVIVESRQASDTHVLALPLAYVYARDSLVLAGSRPDPALFRQFLRWADDRYRRVFFVGGGGTELISKSVRVLPVASERFQIPEYEHAYRAYPREVRQKEFDFSVYELRPEPVTAEPFALDVGTLDDLFVRRFHAKEVHGSSGTTFRWSSDVSFVSLLGIAPERRTLTVWAAGPRPSDLDAPRAELFLNDRQLGAIAASPNFEPYRFEIPVNLAARLGAGDEAGQLRIETNVWTPAEVVGGTDTRRLGIMVDRVTVAE